MPQRRRAPVPHTELYTSTRTGSLVRVACTCPLGADHTHDEWLAEFSPETRS